MNYAAGISRRDLPDPGRKLENFSADL